MSPALLLLLTADPIRRPRQMQIWKPSQVFRHQVTRPDASPNSKTNGNKKYSDTSREVAGKESKGTQRILEKQVVQREERSPDSLQKAESLPGENL